jgi:7,8-dihydropterin-6-yl-methyl-4-(beta-D-ribofuranosyl)aminobenzene 5'-phosphate synthase
MQPIALEPVDGVHTTTLIDNSCDILLPDEGLVRRWGRPVPLARSRSYRRRWPRAARRPTSCGPNTASPPSSKCATAAGTGGFLFDTGVSPDGLVANLDRLAISPDTFEAVVLSHGHFDHVMGLDGLARRLGRRNLPLILHPDAWTRRRFVLPNGAWELPMPSRSGIEGAGFQIIEDRQPSFLLDGKLLVTGEVDRTTDFEKGMPIHQAWRDGDWQPDPLIHDDQAAVIHVRDKGLVIQTGCGHAGIVNIARHAKRLTGIDRVYALLGGFHLTGGLFEPIIPQTVAALAGEAPSVLVPAHCTGWKAQQALAAGLPTAFKPNSVGSRFEL